MSDLVQVLPGQVVLHKRERSSVWQCRYKGKDKKWHRTSTGEKDQKAAADAALRLYYEAEVKRENKLPVNTKRFDSVAKQVVQNMQDELKAGEGKSVYNSYISAINGHLIPFFGKHNIDSITAGLLSKFDAHRTKKLGRVPAASTITNHNSALNKKFVEAFGKANGGLRPNFMAVGAYDGMRVIYEAAKATQGGTGETLLQAMKGQSFESPRGPVSIDPQTRDVVHNIYVRKVEKVGGQLWNTEVQTFTAVKDPAKAGK